MKKKILMILTGGLILGLSMTSCLDDKIDDLESDHDKMMTALVEKYGLDESNLIEDGIYLSVEYDGILSDTTYPEDGDVLIADVTGYLADGDVFDVTNYNVAVANDIDNDAYIYGPIRIWVGSTISGFSKAIKKVPEGTRATMIIPHEEAFFNYEPVVYVVDLYRVESDILAYNLQQIQETLEALDMDAADSIPDMNNAYSKIVEAGTPLNDTIEPSDSVVIELHAYYAETDEAYVDEFPGRMFFPYNNSGSIVKYIHGDESFPITPIITKVVEEMELDEVRNVVTSSEYGYGSTGFVHPYLGYFIVDPYVPLYYQIRLIRTN